MPGPSEKPPLPKETDPVGEFLEGYLPPLEDRLARSIAAINRPAGRGANDTPPDNKNGKLVFVRRRKREEEEEAAATADSVPDPLHMDAETETELKDTRLGQLLTQCEGDPKLAALAGELQALVRKNPSDEVMQAIEKKFAALTASTSPDAMPAPVLPIKRKVNADPIPAVQPSGAPAPVPDATMPAQAATSKPEQTSVQDAYTEARLAAEFPSGKEQEFSLESKGGRKTRYHFDGKDFTRRKSGVIVATTELLEFLNKGWKIEKKVPDSDPQPVATPIDGSKKPDTAPAPPTPSKKDKPNLTIPPEWELVPKGEQVKPEEWTLVPKETKEAETPAPASPEAPKEEEPSEEDKLRELIDGLRTKVGEARLEYVTTEYQQNSAWMKVKRFFGKSIGEAPADEDTQSVLGRYKLALTNLQEAELALLKKEDFSGEALRERMGKMLNYYKLEERITLFDTRNQVKMESMGGAHTLVTMVESIGREYNKLPRKAKYTLGAICLATGLLTGGSVIGGGAAAAASGLVLIKKLIATTGLAMTIDTRVEQWMEKKRSASAEEEKKTEMSELDKMMAEGNQGVSLERLTALVNKDIGQLDAKFKAQKKEALIRRSAVWGAAAAGAVGMGASWVSHALDSGSSEAAAVAAQERDTLEAARALGVKVPADVPAAGAAVAPELASSSPAGAASAAGSGDIPLSREETYFREVNMTEPMGESAAEVASAETSSQVSALREAYPVTAADGRRGLWGVIDERLKQMPETMKPEERNRIIASIQNLMRQDLEAMSPAERTSAGFAKGDLNLIHKGTVIHFNEFKSLTSERLQAIIDGQSVGAPSGAGVADVIDRPAGIPGSPSLIDQNAIDGGDTAAAQAVAENVRESAYGIPVSPMDHALNQETITRLADQPMAPQNPTAVVQEVIRGETPAIDHSTPVEAPTRVDASFVKASLLTPETVDLHTLANPGGVKGFLETHPEMVIAHGRMVLGMNEAVFGMPQNPSRIPYIEVAYGAVPPNAQNIFMERVLENAFDRRPFPLHPSQVNRLANLVHVVSRPEMFGVLGQPLYGEKVTEYMSRIAAMAVAQGRGSRLARIIA